MLRRALVLPLFLTLLEKHAFVPGGNPHLYRVSTWYKPSSTNVEITFVLAGLPGTNALLQSASVAPSVRAPSVPSRRPSVSFCFLLSLFSPLSQSQITTNQQSHIYSQSHIHNLTITDLHYLTTITNNHMNASRIELRPRRIFCFHGLERMCPLLALLPL
jgi:hypothetical protein